ncbi:hypothetical protein [Clostridium sp.]|uniref:hypothetical protein n=1 Tax=Clostridium sp. TaxID=1506 RepID=UPI002FC8DE8F
MKKITKLNIENGIITILIFSLAIVFSLEIVQTKVQAKENSIQTIEHNKEDNTQNKDKDNKPTEVPKPPKGEDVIIETPVEDEVPVESDDTQVEDSYTEPTWYPEENSSEDWTPPTTTPPVNNPPVVDTPKPDITPEPDPVPTPNPEDEKPNPPLDDDKNEESESITENEAL